MGKQRKDTNRPKTGLGTAPPHLAVLVAVVVDGVVMVAAVLVPPCVGEKKAGGAGG
jgi:hypothetical protein